MRFQVFVRLKSGVLDVQGKAVERGLHGLGFTGASGVRIGKLIELDVEASDEESARSQVNEMCTQLLVNTVIESFEVHSIGGGR